MKLCQKAPATRERLIEIAWARAKHFQSEFHDLEWKSTFKSSKLKAFKQPVHDLHSKNFLIKNLLFPIQEETDPEKNIPQNHDKDANEGVEMGEEPTPAIYNRGSHLNSANLLKLPLTFRFFWFKNSSFAGPRGLSEAKSHGNLNARNRNTTH